MREHSKTLQSFQGPYVVPGTYAVKDFPPSGRRNDLKVGGPGLKKLMSAGGGGGGDSDTYFSDFNFFRHLYLIQSCRGSPPTCPSSVVTNNNKQTKKGRKKWVGQTPTL